MSILDTVKSAVLTNAHGEVNFFRITEGSIKSDGFSQANPDSNGYIVGHSESGHNHVLERGDVVVREITEGGMKILHAILKEPLRLFQSAGSPHKEQIVAPGEYFITNNVDYNPFLQQARRVAD